MPIPNARMVPIAESRSRGRAPRVAISAATTRDPASMCVPYRALSVWVVTTVSGVPAAQRPPATYRTRSTKPATGVISWVTNTTVVPCSWW